MELARSGRAALINAIKCAEKEPGTLYPDDGTLSDVPWTERMVLPPFLGEMGFEIRYFLAAIEPWLRNGWRILAKRPDLYPEGTAFADPDLFTEIATILTTHEAYPIGGAVRSKGDRVTIDVESGMAENGRFVGSFQCAGPDNLKSMLDSAMLEIKLRQAFTRRYLRAPRPLTPWDTNLLTSYDTRPEHMCGGALSLAPTYKPAAFLNPPYAAVPHVGVQMRRLPNLGTRDSDPDLMMAKSWEAAAYLGVPLLVYGHPDGTFRPDGVPNTADLAGDRPLLRYELSMLSQCRLMLAPESGWCDLMCWLQIPTLLEKLGRPHEFTHNRVYHPRLALLDLDQPIAAQIKSLFATGECLPAKPRSPDTPDDMDWDGSWVRALGNYYIFGQ